MGICVEGAGQAAILVLSLGVVGIRRKFAVYILVQSEIGIDYSSFQDQRIVNLWDSDDEICGKEGVFKQ